VSSRKYQNAGDVLDDRAEARLNALREAARLGIADIEAGRFVEFASPTELRQYLQALCDELRVKAGSR